LGQAQASRPTCPPSSCTRPRDNSLYRAARPPPTRVVRGSGLRALRCRSPTPPPLFLLVKPHPSLCFPPSSVRSSFHVCASPTSSLRSSIVSAAGVLAAGVQRHLSSFQQHRWPSVLLALAAHWPLQSSHCRPFAPAAPTSILRIELCHQPGAPS
jgi:hypothetical protein